MAIQFLDNQPITWRTNWATDSVCKTSNEKACTIYSTNDYLFAQWKQTPCGAGSNILCNTDFTNSNSELITNGSFTTNTTGWTLGSGVTRDSVNKWIKFPGTTLAAGLANTSVITTNLKYYDVTFTIGGMTKGSITPKLVTQVGTTVYSAGTYTQTIQANGTGGITFATTTFDGWIDDISVKESVLKTGCFDATYPTQWIVGDGIITKIPGNASQINQSFTTFNTGAYMKVSFRVTNYSAGTLTVYNFGNGTPLATVTADGVYEAYFTSVAAAMIWDVTADFSGSISDISVQEYSNYFSVLLKDTKNMTQEDMSGSITLHEDWVILKHPLFSVDPGCYEICVGEACNSTQANISILFNGSADFNFSVLSGSATFTPSGQYVIIATANGTSSNVEILIESNTSNWPLNYSSMVIDYFVNFASASNGFDGELYLIDKNGNDVLLNFDLTSGDPFSIGTTFLTNQQTLTSDPIQFKLVIFPQISGLGSDISFDLGHLIVQQFIPGGMTEYCSNCIEVIDYPDADYCTQWVGGTNGEDSFGFHFNPSDTVPFQIGARVRSMMINPKYKGDLKKYSTSTGNNIVTRSNSDKVYTLFIDHTDEHTHDWLRLAVISDTVKVGAYSGQANINYTNTDGDYQPEWPDNLGNWPAAQARVELSPKTGTLYNNNAG